MAASMLPRMGRRSRWENGEVGPGTAGTGKARRGWAGLGAAGKACFRKARRSVVMHVEDRQAGNG